MKIGIDGYEANVPNRVGIGTYAFEILKGLYTLVNAASGRLVVQVYLPNPPLSDLPPETDFWKYKVCKPQRFWTFLGLPLAIVSDGFRPDVFFTPTHYVPRWVRVPKVMAVMDLSYLHYPELFKAKDLHQLTNWTSYSLKQVKAVVTISEFTKNAILDSYSLKPEQVTVTHLGLRMPTTSPAVDIGSIYSLQHPYILSVGTIQPRKNFSALIESFANLKAQHPEFQELDLVIVGKKGWLYEDIMKAPAKYGVEQSVKFLEFVPDEHLPDLYRQAKCFVLVSLYEGFGLPVLEAMAHGTLVVVSNTSSLPEIAGDVGFQVDPQSTASITSGLVEVLQLSSTEAGKARIEAGRERVKLFSWEKAAKTTLDILEKVGDNHQY